MSLTFAAADAPSLPLHVVSPESLDAWRARQPGEVLAWLDSTGFAAKAGRVALLPGPGGALAGAVAGIGDEAARARRRFVLGAAQAALPEGTYHLEAAPGAEACLDMEEQALGWLLSRYRFDRYRKARPPGAMLKAPAGVDAGRVEAIAAGEALTRDLVNTPAADMGPDGLEAAARELAGEFGASCSAIVGEDLARQGLPLVHAVGRASETPPRLIDMAWGRRGPSLALVGKGVCFDTGGLNLKPGAAMELMKKDMGGGAAVLGLARMIMALGLPLRLRVLVPAVENSVGERAMRPGDVLASRKGPTVVVSNTDAEGRLVLADALALADEAPPDLMVSMATLTGAARVAVGPDIAPFYATDPALADAIRRGGAAAADPVWEMPFHAPYEAMIEPGVADLDNAPKGGFAGSIAAALFLRRFVTATPRYVHFDIYGWQPRAAPGRPKGGVGQGARAVLAALPELLGL